MINNMSNYQISDEDIEAMLRYLKIFHPEQATKEYAEGWLQYWKSEFRKISLEDLSNETLEKLFDSYQKSKG
jgi:hypothetical protein